jgi:hypothetical protein
MLLLIEGLQITITMSNTTGLPSNAAAAAAAQHCRMNRIYVPGPPVMS